MYDWRWRNCILSSKLSSLYCKSYRLCDQQVTHTFNQNFRIVLKLKSILKTAQPVLYGHLPVWFTLPSKAAALNTSCNICLDFSRAALASCVFNCSKLQGISHKQWHKYEMRSACRPISESSTDSSDSIASSAPRRCCCWCHWAELLLRLLLVTLFLSSPRPTGAGRSP